MMTKKTEPIIEYEEETETFIVIGTKVEYRLFGILLYKKTFLSPEAFGIKEYNYQICI